MKRILRWVLIVAAVIAAVVAVVVIVVHMPPVQRYALERIKEVLHDRNIQLQAEELDYNLAAASVSLRDVVVRSAQAPDLPPIARIGRLSVDLSLPDLLAGAYVVEGAVIENADFSLLVTRDGRDNLPALPQSDSQESGPLDFFIAQARISGASFRYEDRAQNLSLSLPGWKATVDGQRAAGSQKLALELTRPGTVTLEDRSLPLEKLQVDATLDGQSLDLSQFVVALEDSTLTASGTIGDLSSPRLDLETSADLDVRPLADLAGIREPLRGSVKMSASLQGPLPLLSAQVHVSGNRLGWQELQGIAADARLHYQAAHATVSVQSLVLSSPFGGLTAQGVVALRSSAGESRLQARLRSLQTLPLQRVFQPQGPFIASAVSGGMDAHWPGLQTEKAVATADLSLASVRMKPAKDVLPVSGNVAARVRPERISLDVRSLATLGATSDGQILLVRDQRLDGRLQTVVADLQETVSRLGTFLGRKEPLLPTQVAGRATAVVDLDGTPSSPAADLRVHAPALSVGALRGVNLNAQVSYAPDRIAVRTAELQWRNETLRVAGTVGLKGESPRLDLRATVRDFGLQTALRAAGKADVPASGTFSAQVDVGGTVANPDATVVGQGRGLSAYNEILGDLDLRASLAGQQARFSQFALRKPDGSGTLRATGTYHLKTKQYSLEAQARDWQIEGIQVAQNVPLRARLDFDAAGSGTVEDPRLDASLRAEHIHVRQETLGALSAKLQVANGQAVVEARVPHFALTANATASVEKPYVGEFTLRADNTDLSRIPVESPKLSGNVTAVVSGSGPLSRPAALTAQASIPQMEVQVNGRTIRNASPIEVDYAQQRLNVQSATLVAEGSRLSLKGMLPLEPGHGNADLRVEGLFDLASLSTYLPEPQGIRAQGELSLDGVVRGTLRKLDPTLTIRLADGSVLIPGNEPEVTGLSLQARLELGVLDIAELAARWAGADINASGEVPLTLLPGTLPLRMPQQSTSAGLQLSVQGLELGQIAALPERISGRLSLRGEVQVPALRLDAVTGRLAFTELALDLGGVPLRQQGDSVLVIDDAVARVQNFQLAGQAAALRVSGSVGLEQPRPLDLSIQGNLNAGILAAFTANITAAGQTTFDLAAGGTLQRPRLDGFVQLENGLFSLPDPRLDATQLDARINLSGDQLRLTRLEGSVNGGDLTGSGVVTLAQGKLQDVDLRFTLDDFFLNFPEGLRTRSNMRLNVTNEEDDLVLAGMVHVQDGSFTEDVTIGGELLEFFRGGQTLELSQDRNAFLERFRFDLGLATDAPIVVDNNLAELELSAHLQLVGTYYRPALTGRARLLQGGELRLNERSYAIERGVVTFTSETRIEPSLDILARTEVNDYDISMQITGRVNDLDTNLTSDPPLPQPDLVSLLLTGRTLEEARGSGLQVAQEQLLSVLAGGLTTRLSSQLQQATGLSLVRIEPNLIAAEGDPGARLTLGEDITPDLSLIYSMNLRDSSDQVYIARYDISRRFTTSVVRQSDNSYRFEFGHVIEFGGEGGRQRRETTQKRRLDQVAVSGNSYFADKKLLDEFGIKSGDIYDFFKIRRGLDDVRSLYADAGLLESRVRLQRNETGNKVDLALQVEPGPKMTFSYVGFDIPGSLREDVRKIWMRGVFDAQRTAESQQAIRNWMVQQGYLEARIESEIEQSEANKQVAFHIAPGIKYQDVDVAFPGASGLSRDELLKAIDDRDFKAELHTEPNRVTGFLENYYQENGYLSAKVGDREYEFDPDAKTARLVVRVEEGRRYRFGRIEFRGNQHVSSAELKKAVPVDPGDRYRPELREAAYTAIQDLYFQKGFNQLKIEPQLRTRKDAGEIDLIYDITENRQQVVMDVEVTGNDVTGESLVRNQLKLHPGDVLDMDKLGESRSQLYSTGAFNLVDIEREELPAGPNHKLEPHQVAVRLIVKLQEIPPYKLRYGAFFDTERGLGGISDFTARNVLKGARVLGLRTRGDGQRQDARLYFNQPQLSRFPWQTDAQVFFIREDFRKVESRQPFVTDRFGLTLTQESRAWKNYIFNYGYRIERVRTFAADDPALRSSLVVAPLTGTLTRETRDNQLDSHRGSFQSHAFEYGAGFLGSDQRFLRYFGQYFKYIPLSRPAEVPFGGLVKQPRWVFATAARVGLASGLGGQDLVPAERFFAGGGTTVRGFEQDSLGPRDANGQALGGNALFVLNNELRFPIAWWFEGVGFVDVGNVYPKVSDFRPWDIRSTAGAGLRLRTPYFLLRLDAGFKLDRRPGESAGKVFISIGQAF